MPRSGKTRRVLSNDDGWILNTDPPLTPETMWDKMIGPHEGSPIDGFLWSVGGHDTYSYETEIGEKFGEGYDNLDKRSQVHVENVRYLTENHGGPITVIAELCGRAGMDFFPSVRMNEHYDMDESSPSYSRLRREHPEYLIGRGKDIVGPSLEWGIRTGLDYAIPEVRRYMASIIVELLSRFDVDGIELDYMRHPAFFRIEEAYANRYFMTDFIAYIRQQIDLIGKQKGKKLDLIVRIPPTLGDCTRIGLDVATWIAEELIDIVVVGGFIPFEMPMHEFVETASQTDVKILGCLEALRPTVDELTMRAVASRYWQQGVAGLYLFNYYNMPQKWKRDVLSKLINTDDLARLDKRYEFDQRGKVRPNSQLGFSFQNAIPSTQLPTALETTIIGPSTQLILNIADDLEQAKAQDTLGECTIGLRLQNMGAKDQIEVCLNDKTLPVTNARQSTGGWTRDVYGGGAHGYPSQIKTDTEPGTVIEWTVDAPPLKHGTNCIAVHLATADPDRQSALVLADVRTWIRYK